jgi:hypothetical protein
VLFGRHFWYYACSLIMMAVCAANNPVGKLVVNVPGVKSATAIYTTILGIDLIVGPFWLSPMSYTPAKVSTPLLCYLPTS